MTQMSLSSSRQVIRRFELADAGAQDLAVELRQAEVEDLVWPSSVSMTFEGFKSRWVIPR